MAKENYISLKGQLRGDVRFVTDPDTGEITSAMFPLYVLRRNIWDRAGNLSPKFDRPIILTSDKEIIRAVKELKKYDIVEVKDHSVLKCHLDIRFARLVEKLPL